MRRQSGWLVVIGLVALYAAARYLARLDLGWLWFQSVHYTQVFWLMQGLPVLFFVIAFLVFGVGTYLLIRPLQRSLVGLGHPWMLQGGVVIDLQRLRPSADLLLVRPVAWLLSAFVGFVTASSVSADWKDYLLALQGASFGRVDPIFHLDAGFYVFRLPAISDALGTIATFIVLAGLGRLAVTAGKRHEIGVYDRAARIPAALTVLFSGIGVWLSRYGLLSSGMVVNQSSGQPIVVGADYFAVHWTLPLLFVVAVLLVAVGLLGLLRTRRTALMTSWRRLGYGAGAALGIYVLGSLGGSLVLGSVLARSQQSWEAPFMSRTIAWTRFGFDIQGLHVTPYPGNAQITAAGLQHDATTISNIRLADPQAFKLAFSQLQTFRQYYSFPFSDVTIDRYYIHGSPLEVILGAREINSAYAGSGTQAGLLQYTHGYGVIGAGVTSFSSSGLPNLLIRNMPVQDSLPGTKITQPRIYYGQDTTTNVIAPNALGELDYPTGQASALTNYSGPGIPFDQYRLTIALSQGLGYLLQGETTVKSMYLMNRQIFQRVELVAPWLQLDPKANLVIRRNGSLVWLLDGYTSTDLMPYSQSYYYPSLGTVNYMRNSVKVTVSASTGAIHLYAVGHSPILEAWERIFPGLVQPLSKMPSDIRAHLQYPDVLFRAQAAALTRYHVSNTDTFYAGQDNWSLPQELYQNIGSPQPMPSEQIIARLPSGGSLQFMRVLPFVPPGRPNMVGWFAAQEDGANYGRLVLYELSSGSLIPGPMQVESEISQDPTISADITLWDQHGSSVIRGNLMEIPVGGGMLAVEPLYLEASANAIPELHEVIVAYNNQVAMAPTLQGALSQIFGTAAPASPQQGKSGNTTPGTGKAPAGLAQLISSIEQQNTLVQSDMQSGDWTKLGADEQKLQSFIAQLGKYAAKP